MDKPEIGTTMYFVCEHLYYVPYYTAPLREYCVLSAVVTDHFQKDFRLLGTEPDKGQVPRHYRFADIGKTIFFNKGDAIALAEKETKRDEKAFPWDAPMRRPWLEQKP